MQNIIKLELVLALFSTLKNLIMLRFAVIFLLFSTFNLQGQNSYDDFKKRYRQDISQFKDNINDDLKLYKKWLAKVLAKLKTTERAWNKITIDKDVVEADPNIPEPTIEKLLDDKRRNPDLIDEPDDDDNPKPDFDDDRPIPFISDKDIPSMSPLPKNSGRITSEFGYRRHPTYKFEKFHYGIDIAAPAGTPIYTTAPGKVIHAGSTRGYGNYIIIEHVKNYKTAYAHLSKINVMKGQWLSQGTSIGKVGKTGLATGNHLHYEVIKNGKKVNPRAYF